MRRRYYVNARWLGGMLTNFKTMRGRVDRLEPAQKMQEDGTFDMLPQEGSHEASGRDRQKLEKYLGGVTEMSASLVLCLWWTPQERNAINEARKLHIPIVAIGDTNCDPDEIDYVIPGNDDAIRAIRLISSVMANAIMEGKQGEDRWAAEADKCRRGHRRLISDRWGKRPGARRVFKEKNETIMEVLIWLLPLGRTGPARNDRRGHDGLQEGPHRGRRQYGQGR